MTESFIFFSYHLATSLLLFTFPNSPTALRLSTLLWPICRKMLTLNAKRTHKSLTFRFLGNASPKEKKRRRKNWNGKAIDHRQNYAGAHDSRSTSCRAWAIVIYVTLISRRARRHTTAGAIYPDREYCFRNSDIR